MTKKEKVFTKFDGKCAYTGQPLASDWQIDHVDSKRMFEQVFVTDAYYQCKETGAKISLQEYQNRSKEIVDTPKRHSEDWMFLNNYKYHPARYKPHPDCNKLENLFPALRIVNHYKRSLDLEQFRDRMKTFHTRLAKQPKNPTVKKSISRKAYMWEVADAFGVKPDLPFDGIFYFEK